MPVYISTSCLANGSDIFDVLEAYAKAGLKNVELGSMHRYAGEISPDRLKAYGFNFLCHHFFPPPPQPVFVNLASTDPVILKDSKEHLKRALEFCHQMGIGLFTFHAGFRTDPHPLPNGRFEFPKDKVVPYETAFDIFVDSIEKINAYALERGVKIGIENNVLSDYNVVDGENPFLLLCEAWEFDKLWKRITSPNVGVLLDLGHLKPTSHWLKFDRYQFIDAVKDRVFAFHIHENNGQLDKHLTLDKTSWCLEIIKRDCFRNVPVVIESSKLTLEQIIKQIKLVERNIGQKQGRFFYPCAVCGESNEGSLERLYEFGLFSNRQTVSVCRRCGTVCLNPRWNEARYAEYYSREYWQLPQGYNEAPRQARGRKIVQDLQGYLARDARIMEIGCGEGYNLIAFKENGFNDLTGLEPSSECCQKLRNTYNINCIAGVLTPSSVGLDAGSKYDCCILSHVLAHFVEPQKALEIINGILKAGGIIYILTPNFYGVKPYHQFTDIHTFYFSRVSLEILLNNSGFTIENYFETPENEIAVMARNSVNRPAPVTTNATEYQMVWRYLKGNRPTNVKHTVIKLMETFIMKVLTEDSYEIIKRYLRRLKVYEILGRISR